jgi:hypothetical protein
MSEAVGHRRADDRCRKKERQADENQHQADTAHSNLIFRIAATGASRVEPEPVSAPSHLIREPPCGCGAVAREPHPLFGPIAVRENPVIDGRA